LHSTVQNRLPLQILPAKVNLHNIAYTGQNPDITLSGGVSINDAKFPLYQAAEE
jgi:CRISPR-associated protein Csm1